MSGKYTIDQLIAYQRQCVADSLRLQQLFNGVDDGTITDADIVLLVAVLRRERVRAHEDAREAERDARDAYSAGRNDERDEHEGGIW